MSYINEYSTAERMYHPSTNAAKTAAICSVVVVCFHSSAKLPTCLKALSKHGSLDHLEVIVVNNSQSDADEIKVLCENLGVNLIQNMQNVGFGRGCNLGASLVTCEYVLFLNADVRISFESTRLLVNLAKEDVNLVAIGPVQISSSGKIYAKRRVLGARVAAQPPIRKIGAIKSVVSTSFISGGAIMVLKKAFDQIGGFPNQIFLFHEDDVLCMRLSQLGMLAYASGIVALHDWGTSTPPSLHLTYVRSWHLGFSKVYVLREYCGNRMPVGVLAEAVSKVISPAMLTARGRTKGVAFFSGVISALRNTKSVDDMVPK